MKNVTILVFCLFFTKLTAQVYQGQNLHKGRNEISYFMFSNQDEKDLEKDLEGYLKGFGKTTKPAKNITRLEKIKKSELPEELETIDVIFENNKKIQKISFFFLDKNSDILSSLKLKEGEATDFVEKFQKFTFRKLEIKLAQENVRMVESNLSDAKRNESKIEKSLESNLKDQEKLGKKLDNSPEMLTKALSEKEKIVGELYTDTVADKKAKEELEKASSKKEREIQKIQKEKAKAETKLSKRETEFNALKDELFQAKAMVKSLESVLMDANTVLINLK